MVMDNHPTMSSGNDEWETPQDFFDMLNDEFHFNIDPCASSSNHKCDLYYTVNDDGLKKSWGGYRVFCNPPYSQIAKWVEKAYVEAMKPNTIVVLLIPARTDTKWFHNFLYGHAELRFIKGRLKFGSAKYNAPFPSMVAILKRGET